MEEKKIAWRQILLLYSFPWSKSRIPVPWPGCVGIFLYSLVLSTPLPCLSLPPFSPSPPLSLPFPSLLPSPLLPSLSFPPAPLPFLLSCPPLSYLFSSSPPSPLSPCLSWGLRTKHHHCEHGCWANSTRADLWILKVFCVQYAPKMLLHAHNIGVPYNSKFILEFLWKSNHLYVLQIPMEYFWVNTTDQLLKQPHSSSLAFEQQLTRYIARMFTKYSTCGVARSILCPAGSTGPVFLHLPVPDSAYEITTLRFNINYIFLAY